MIGPRIRPLEPWVLERHLDVVYTGLGRDHLIEVQLLVRRQDAAGKGVVQDEPEVRGDEALPHYSPPPARCPGRIEQAGVHARQQSIDGHLDLAIQAWLLVELARLRDR